MSVTQAEFEEILLTRPLDEIVEMYLFAGEAFAFRSQPGAMDRLRDHLAGRLGVDPAAIGVVGSAKLGFSLSPDAYPHPFTEHSDIDVVVVDEQLFDLVWRTLLAWNYPRRNRLPAPEWRWAASRMSDIYWGWVVPRRFARHEGLLFADALKPLRDLSTRWFSAFRSLSLLPDFAGRDVSGRLYRTWDHARLYHADGLRQIRAILQTRA
jgi:hypothetical protein